MCVSTVCACSFSCLCVCVCYITLVLSSIIYYWILLDNVIIGTASHLSIRLYFTNRRSFHSPLGYCCCYWLLNECSLCLCLCLYSWLILHEGSCTLTLIVCLYLLTVNSLHLPPLPVSRLDCFWCCYLIIRLSPLSLISFHRIDHLSGYTQSKWVSEQLVMKAISNGYIKGSLSRYNGRMSERDE